MPEALQSIVYTILPAFKRVIFVVVKLSLAYILIIFFALRAAPVKELGKMWAKAQAENPIDKDLPCDSDEQDDSNLKEKLPLKIMLPHSGILALSIHFSNIGSSLLQLSEKLPHSFIPEVPTPPPNSRA